MNHLSRDNPMPVHKLYPFFWLVLAILMLGMNYLPNNFIEPFSDRNETILLKNKQLSKTESFDPHIAAKFTSVDNLYLYLITRIKDTTDKRRLLELATNLLRRRFVHAYSIYGVQENWIAVLCGKLIWRNLSAKVAPNDILAGNVAACSQVSIVMMSLCKKIGIPTRKVGLNGHYTLEARIGEEWYFVDLDVKPDFKAINGRKSLATILKNKEQYQLYKNTILDSPAIRRVFATVKYGEQDAHPAPRAYFFHQITKICSHWGWLVPLYFSILGFVRSSSRSRFALACG